VPLFYLPVVDVVSTALAVICIVVEVWAFVSCTTQRAEAFGVVGRIPKGGWVAMLFAATLVSLLFGTLRSPLGLIAVVVALVYLLDLRPALRDAVDGHGPW
jgi:hypothetical protein